MKMKEEPVINWAKENGKSIAIIGIMREEGGGGEPQIVCFFEEENLSNSNL